MATNQVKAALNSVVDLVSSSSDDDDAGPHNSAKAVVNTSSIATASMQHENLAATLDTRSFWKAGNYDVGPSKSVFAQGELEHARVHPKFLHSNATSHKWAFGAIAELLDNAVDEICNGATFVKVDRIHIMKDNSPALLFQDDGGGMDPEGIRKCMSLGYSSKKTNTTIGQYGNGFKTSTMRLGADAIVFSRATRAGKATQSIGLLSYTFLRKTGQDDVIVPMVDFDVSNHWAEPIIYSSQEDWSSNLKTILEWSPFASKEDLMIQFEDIGSHGTKVILFNLWLNDEGIYELNFDDDEEDIRLRDEANRGNQSKVKKRVAELQSHISYRLRYSLRAYASILYLRKFKNFQIIIRGKPVQQFNIAEDLNHAKVVNYKPQLSAASKEVSVMTTLGVIKEFPSINVSGYNVYHKNRLIRPYWKVTSDGSSRGSFIVGVLEANFIEPAHDKQDFERSALFIRLETKLKQMMLDYWKDHCHILGYQTNGTHTNDKKERALQPPVVRSAPKPHDQHIGDVSANIQKKRLLDQSESPCTDVMPVDDVPASMSIDQLCEENIQLFMRCEDHTLKEIELKNTVEALEKELEEAKQRCALLSAHMKIQKQMNQKTTTEKSLTNPNS